MTSSLLDAEATSVTKPVTRGYRDLCLQPVYAEYQATAAFYRRVDLHCQKLYSPRLSACRTSAWFALSQSTRIIRAASRTCRLRWCPMCSKVKANYASHTVSHYLADRSDARFLTLTLRHSHDPLTVQVDRLYEYFRRLRRLSEFRFYVTGGVWFFQVKQSSADSKWHPHLHCLVTGDFFPKARLSLLWKQVTGGSVIVDVKAIKDSAGAARYVSRYSARPASLEHVSPDSYLDLYDAFAGRRLAGTWGSCRHIRLTPPPAQPGQAWRNIGSWSLITGLAATDPRANAIWYAFTHNVPLSPIVDLAYLDAWLDDAQGKNSAAWLPDTYIDELLWRPP